MYVFATGNNEVFGRDRDKDTYYITTPITSDSWKTKTGHCDINCNNAMEYVEHS